MCFIIGRFVFDSVCRGSQTSFPSDLRLKIGTGGKNGIRNLCIYFQVAIIFLKVDSYLYLYLFCKIIFAVDWWDVLSNSRRPEISGWICQTGREMLHFPTDRHFVFFLIL